VNKRDILIIGGGVIGLTIARELHKRGAGDITILERGEIGCEASWAAAGMLSPNIETDIGSPFHVFCRESLELYPSLADELLNETGIDIELDRTGTIFVSLDDEGGLEILAEYRRLRENRIEIESWSKEEILRAEPHLSSTVQVGNFYPRDCQVENRKLLSALESYSQDNGVEIIEQTTVSSFIIENGCVAGARTKTGEFRAGETILAAGAWSSMIEIGSLTPHLGIKPIRGQMIWFDCGERLLEKVIYGPGCYLVPRKDGRLLAGSTTEDVGFEKAVTDSAVEALRDAAYRILPDLRTRNFGGSWSGLRPRSSDELPVIGGLGDLKGLTVATGHYRNGILLAPLTAKVVADSLTGQQPVPNAFSPGRFLKDNAAKVGN
jgi:glycine oxidase